MFALRDGLTNKPESVVEIMKYITPEWVTAIASVASAVGIFFAFFQLQFSKKISQLQFEDSFAKEYRELLRSLPAVILIGTERPEEELYKEKFDELYRYIDLTNEQICLRQNGRIGNDVWKNWQAGIAHNLALPAFKRAWEDIKSKNGGIFSELRRLENENFKSDPKDWKKSGGLKLCLIIQRFN